MLVDESYSFFILDPVSKCIVLYAHSSANNLTVKVSQAESILLSSSVNHTVKLSLNTLFYASAFIIPWNCQPEIKSAI